MRTLAITEGVLLSTNESNHNEQVVLEALAEKVDDQRVGARIVFPVWRS